MQPEQQAQENVVHYELYDHTGASSETQLKHASTLFTILTFDAGLTATANSGLDDLRVQCLQAVLPYTHGYIWQDGMFGLQSSRDVTPPWARAAKARHAAAHSQQSSDSAYLWGITSFGDNIEDEWFIVWLLLQLTLQVCQH